MRDFGIIMYFLAESILTGFQLVVEDGRQSAISAFVSEPNEFLISFKTNTTCDMLFINVWNPDAVLSKLCAIN